MNYAQIASNLSSEEIIGLLKVKEQFAAVQSQLEEANQLIKWFKKQLFGQKSEKRYNSELPTVGTQLYLSQQHEELAQAAQQQANRPKTQQIKSYQRGKAKKLDLANAVSETGLRFDDTVPVKTIKVPNKEIEGLDSSQYEVIATKVQHRLAQRSSYQVLRYEMDVVKIKATQAIVSPKPKASVFENSFADVSFLAHLLIDKYLYHLPLYRQEQRLIAAGIKVSRGTLVDFTARAGLLLAPIYKAQLNSILESLVLAMDEVPIKAGVNKAKHKMNKGYFWPMFGDKKELAFHYANSRSEKVLLELLGKEFKGTLLTDGYQAYVNYSAASAEVIHALCWSHARRYFIKAEQVEPELSATALDYIQCLYKVEQAIKGKDSLLRQSVRGDRSKLIVDQFFEWLRKEQGRNSFLPTSPFTKAIFYSLEREAGLRVFLSNPDLALDTNHVERQIRPVVIGRKNWLFCFSETGAVNSGVIFSLIATCRLHDIDPYTYLVDVMQRVQIQPNSQVQNLTPRLWKEHFSQKPLTSDCDLIYS